MNVVKNTTNKTSNIHKPFHSISVLVEADLLSAYDLFHIMVDLPPLSVSTFLFAFTSSLKGSLFLTHIYQSIVDDVMW